MPLIQMYLTLRNLGVLGVCALALAGCNTLFTRPPGDVAGLTSVGFGCGFTLRLGSLARFGFDVTCPVTLPDELRSAEGADKFTIVDRLPRASHPKKEAHWSLSVIVRFPRRLMGVLGVCCVGLVMCANVFGRNFLVGDKAALSTRELLCQDVEDVPVFVGQVSLKLGTLTDRDKL